MVRSTRYLDGGAVISGDGGASGGRLMYWVQLVKGMNSVIEGRQRSSH